MPSFFQIVTNTPLWVWPLMVFVLWLGLQGLRPRVIPVWRIAILPTVSLATSLGGIAQSASPAGAAAGWGLALIAFLPLGWAFGQDRPVRLRPEDGNARRQRQHKNHDQAHGATLVERRARRSKLASQPMPIPATMPPTAPET